jgi:hypothetical protein
MLVTIGGAPPPAASSGETSGDIELDDAAWINRHQREAATPRY